MPSFFSKALRPSAKKVNPYSEPVHPSNSAAAPATSTAPWTPTRETVVRRGSLEDAGDLMAEARRAAGRDATTGKPVPQPKSSRLQLSLKKRFCKPEDGKDREPEARGNQRQQADAGSNPGRPPALDAKYNSYLREMREKQLLAMGQSLTGHYAPTPRPATEYYAPGSGGGL